MRFTNLGPDETMPCLNAGHTIDQSKWIRDARKRLTGIGFQLVDRRLHVVFLSRPVNVGPEEDFFDEYTFDTDNLTRLLAVEVSQQQLDSIEELHWGEGEIQFRVWSQFDGESDEFHIRSLAGIEALRNLRKLTVVPIDSLPADQVAALRAAGVTVDGPW